MHKWHFFRAGGVDQVSLRDRADLAALAELDQKLWVALAMPTRDVDVDPATLDLLDPDKDGRVRVPDIRAAVTWVGATWSDPDLLFEGGDSLRLDAIKDGPVRRAAERVLRDLGKKHESTVTLDDAIGVVKAFAATTLNGDGVVFPACTDDAAARQVIEDAIATVGSVPDRSGHPGVDEATLTRFYDEVEKLAAWEKGASDDAPLAAAADALVAVRDKIDDFFTRCRLAAFDPESAAALNPKVVSADAEEIARQPLARVAPGAALPLAGAVNPAWAARLATYATAAVTPIVGARTALSADDHAAVIEKLAPVLERRASRPATAVEKLGIERVLALADGDGKAAVMKVIEADRALAPEYAEIAAVEKALRFQRDLARVLHNFVNFSDFYSDGDGAFQAGTLYIDGRACHLCVAVTDATKHGTLAGMSSAYLAYCDITRGGEKKTIAVAVTNGDADHLVVGRNGVFYDRKGQDWDATITKIISNPISVREAFWAPYKKLARMIEDQVGKRAAAAEAASEAKVQAAATQVAHADKTATPAAPVPPPPAAAPKKIDVGTVAAIGVAIGGIGALVVGVLATFLGLGKWMPLGIATLLLLVSGPSMLLAWMKLRQRNLGPILDANGWAINGRARINVAFGAALTELARLPKGARRSLDDPYADKRAPWRLYTAIATLALLGGTWYVGKLDRWLPDRVKSTTVLGGPITPPAPAPAPPPPG